MVTLAARAMSRKVTPRNPRAVNSKTAARMIRAFVASDLLMALPFLRASHPAVAAISENRHLPC